MAFPQLYRDAARTTLRNPTFNECGFLPLQATVTIGYVTGSGPHGIDVVTGAPILAGAEGTSFSARLEPDPINPKLHWVRVAQGYGSVLYTWQSGGRTFHFLSLVTTDPEYSRKMEGAEEWAKRRRLALQLHCETGLPFPMLNRLVRSVKTYRLAMLGIGLASWLYQQAEQNIEAAKERADRLTLMNNTDRLANLYEYQLPADARSGTMLGDVCRGARIVLFRQTE